MVDLRKQVSVANHLVESRGMETMNEHVRELKVIVDQCKIKQVDADALIHKQDLQMGELKVEIEVARRRASVAENELLVLRKGNYQLEL